MPLTDLWTLEPDGTPASAATLSARGFSRATLARASQTAAVLSLTKPTGTGMTEDLGSYTWGSAWVLRRDGEIVFRGYISEAPRRSGDANGEAILLTLRDAWWKLDRTPYSQEWRHAAGAELAMIRTGRARLAWNATTGDREDTADALAAVIAAAAHAGITITLDTSDMTPLVPPPIEALNQNCGPLLRDILRWHPECSARIVPGEFGDTLVVSDRAAATVTTITIGNASLASAELTRRDDLVVDSVHVKYEAETSRSAQIPGEEETDPAVIRTRRRLAVYSDIYPPASPLTWRSMLVTLPWRQGEGGAAGDPTPPLPHRQPVKTRPLPGDGDYDTDAQKFYLKMTGLEALGLTVDDIKLPTTTADNIQAHTLAFAHPADDPNDPLFEMPSAINPASTPLWRPTTVGDFPRYLVSGTLAEWMNVKAAEVRCRATVAVRKSTVDALEARDRAIFMAKRPRIGTVQTVDAYLIEADFVVLATTAKTRTYVNWTQTNTGNITTDNAAASTAAEEAVVILDLAESLYTPRSVAPYEGGITLMAEEAGGTDYVGGVIRLVHADRSDWTTMRALVQSETLDLGDGTTSLTFGLPAHLSPQDIAALYEAPRKSAGGTAGGVFRPPIQPTEAEEEGEEDDDDEGAGVFPSTVPPVIRGETVGLFDSSLWGLEILDPEAGTVRISNPGLLKRTSALDNSGLITIGSIGSTFTAAAGKALVLKIEPDLTVTLELVGTNTTDWPAWPYPLETEESSPAGLWVMTNYRFTLWDFVADSDDPDAIKVKNSGVFAEWRGIRGHLRLSLTEDEDKDGHVVPCLEPVLSVGCRRS